MMRATWRALGVVGVLATGLACGGLLPSEPAIPEGGPGMLRLWQIEDADFGTSKKAAWDAHPESIGRFDCSDGMGVEAKCELLVHGDTVVGVQSTFRIEHGLGPFEEAWGPPRVRWEAPQKDKYEEKFTSWYWVDEQTHTTAKVLRIDPVYSEPMNLQLWVWRYQPIDEWLGDGELFAWQTKRWMGLTRGQLNAENSDINEGEFAFTLTRNHRYNHNPRFYLHFDGGRYGTKLVGWETPLFYYSDKGFRSAIQKAMTAKLGKPKKAKDGALVYRSEDPRIVLRDSGIAWNLEVGEVPKQGK